jgi:hypothetical protein
MTLANDTISAAEHPKRGRISPAPSVLASPPGALALAHPPSVSLDHGIPLKRGELEALLFVG